MHTHDHTHEGLTQFSGVTHKLKIPSGGEKNAGETLGGLVPPRVRMNACKMLGIRGAGGGGGVRMQNDAALFWRMTTGGGWAHVICY